MRNIKQELINAIKLNNDKISVLKSRLDKKDYTDDAEKINIQSTITSLKSINEHYNRHLALQY